jgi:hypothetical protein
MILTDRESVKSFAVQANLEESKHFSEDEEDNLYERVPGHKLNSSDCGIQTSTLHFNRVMQDSEFITA